MKEEIFDFIIIGGGLAGLCAAIDLSRKDYKVLLLERHAFPHHKVCGEYVSNEVIPYLHQLGFSPSEHGAPSIRRLVISTKEGKTINTPLPLGGFGISRFHFDNELYKLAHQSADVRIENVVGVSRTDQSFSVTTRTGKEFLASFVLGAFGKRSNVDYFLERDFIGNRTEWIAVKSHYRADFPSDLVSLHNFDGGYCGLSKTESGAVNACYLTTIRSFSRFGDIDTFRKEVLCKNPELNQFFNNADSLFKRPLTISQVSFQSKTLVHNGVFMLGDSAGLIHPLCGNGMAMAILSAQIFCDLLKGKEALKHRRQLELQYQRAWKKAFSVRLNTGAVIQRILINETASNLAFRLGHSFPSLVPAIIRKTHGTAV